MPLEGALDTDNLAQPRYFVVQIVFFVSHEGPVVATHNVICVVSDEACSFNLLRADVGETLEVTYFGPETYLRIRQIWNHNSHGFLV